MASKLSPDARQALTLRQLRSFLLTAQSGSASAAAKIIGVSQPAISQQLQELEKLLRVSLFERVGARLLPTLAGRALIAPIRQIFTDIDLIEPAIAPFRDAESAYLRIGTGATACIHFLPEPIARTRSRNRGLQVLVVTGNVDELVAAVEDGGLDVALVTSERLRPSPSLYVEPLLSEDFVGIIPHALAPLMPTAMRPNDFLRAPLILFEPAGRTREIMDGWFANSGVRPIPVMELGSVEAIKKMVGAGLGMSFIPRLAATVADSELSVRPLNPPLQRHLCLVMRSDKLLDAGLRALLDELRNAASSVRSSISSPAKAT